MTVNHKVSMSHFYVPELLKITFAPCTGCLQSWELNEPHAFDCYGCTFPVLNTEKEKAIFAGMIKKVTGSKSGDNVTQTMQCGRCWIMNKQCFAVSPPFAPFWPLLPPIDLQEAEWWRMASERVVLVHFGPFWAVSDRY